ncbi:hypothetical protein [Gordonia sp. SL306]|uniref:hypothetical protein n=1 Tax=Gordonia sp. SL306 TaxID=2995145 RepID=UPI00226E14CC|nr:hypothetical protein [Gordonia sp. SL306]WAC54272.1 hypothetical protein OVA31_16465 [Gordonia sp. SL306]
MAWETFNTRRRDDRNGPYAVTPDRMYGAEIVLMQRNSETGRTRTVLGFLVGVAYVPVEDVPGWDGEMTNMRYGTLDAPYRSVPGDTYRVTTA